MSILFPNVCSCDETATEAILKSIQIYITLCGDLNMITARDAFVLTLCKSTLPSQYAVHVLTSCFSVTADQKGITLLTC